MLKTFLFFGYKLKTNRTDKVVVIIRTHRKVTVTIEESTEKLNGNKVYDKDWKKWQKATKPKRR